MRRFTSSTGTWAAARVTLVPILVLLPLLTAFPLLYHLERELVQHGREKLRGIRLVALERVGSMIEPKPLL